MNPSKFKVYFFVIFLLLVVSSSVMAKMVSGKVSSSDAATRKISVSTLDPVSGEIKIEDLWVNPDASLTGIRSVGDLKSGDQIWIEADEDTEGNLRASSVTKS